MIGFKPKDQNWIPTLTKRTINSGSQDKPNGHERWILMLTEEPLTVDPKINQRTIKMDPRVNQRTVNQWIPKLTTGSLRVDPKVNSRTIKSGSQDKPKDHQK